MSIWSSKLMEGLYLSMFVIHNIVEHCMESWWKLFLDKKMTCCKMFHFIFFLVGRGALIFQVTVTFQFTEMWRVAVVWVTCSGILVLLASSPPWWPINVCSSANFWLCLGDYEECMCSPASMLLCAWLRLTILRIHIANTSEHTGVESKHERNKLKEKEKLSERADSVI